MNVPLSRALRHGIRAAGAAGGAATATRVPVTDPSNSPTGSIGSTSWTFLAP
jgi:hypothetical protein